MDLSTRILISLALLAGAYGAGFGTEWHLRDVDEEAAQVAAIEHKDDVVEKQDGITADAGKKAEEHQVEIRTVYQTVIRKVPVYVTPKDDAACRLPPGFVLLHNSAAAADLSGLSQPTGEPDGRPVTLTAPSR
jgi:hypothetical protein